MGLPILPHLKNKFRFINQTYFLSIIQEQGKPYESIQNQFE